MRAIRAVDGYNCSVSCVSSGFIGDAHYMGNGLLAGKKASCGTVVVPTMGLVPSRMLNRLLGLTRTKTAVVFARGCPRSMPNCKGLRTHQGNFTRLRGRLPRVTSFSRAITAPCRGKVVVAKGGCRSTLRGDNIIPRRVGAQCNLRYVHHSRTSKRRCFVSSLRRGKMGS